MPRFDLDDHSCQRITELMQICFSQVLYESDGEAGILDEAVFDESVRFLGGCVERTLLHLSENAQLSTCSLLVTLTSSKPLNRLLFDVDGKRERLILHCVNLIVFTESLRHKLRYARKTSHFLWDLYGHTALEDRL